MATNANLPAGFTITTIDGRRCTQVPRSLTTFAGETSFATTTTAAITTTTAAPAQTTSSEETATSTAQDNAPDAAVNTIPESSPASTTSLPPTSEPTTTASSNTIASSPVTTTSSPLTSPTISIPPAAATTSDVIAEIANLSGVSSTTSPPSAFAVAAPVAVLASKGTTPTISSSTQISIVASDVPSTPTATESVDDGSDPIAVSFSSSAASTTAIAAPAKSEESSAAAGISSSPQVMTAPILGGVIGGISFVALIGLLLWFLRRRKRRVSLLTPLTSGTKDRFYEIDRDSVGPTKRSAKWIAKLGYQTDKLHNAAIGFTSGVAGIGASLKSKVVRDRSDTPGVNLNRGNSQFLGEPIPQHSRNNSSVISSHTGHRNIKEKFQNWWEHFTENMSFNWRPRNKNRESADPFAVARGMTEKQANMNSPPDFSQLLDMDDRELRLQAEQRRASLSTSSPSGALGLDFSFSLDPFSLDPFADPPPNTKSQQKNQAWQPPNPTTQTNPFADPITQPQRSISKTATYIDDTRRSRGGLSVSNSNPNTIPQTKTSSIGPISRYPSSIAPNRDSYRDTVLSSFSASARKGKGRSDPFDLERPELWRTVKPPMPSPRDSTMDFYSDPLKGKVLRDSSVATPRVVSGMTPRIVSASGTYGSKYSSGVSSLEEWGDPGPDLGPGSSTEIHSGGGVGGWDERRNTDNVSPLSVESKSSRKGSVGKAM